MCYRLKTAIPGSHARESPTKIRMSLSRAPTNQDRRAGSLALVEIGVPQALRRGVARTRDHWLSIQNFFEIPHAGAGLLTPSIPNPRDPQKSLRARAEPFGLCGEDRRDIVGQRAALEAGALKERINSPARVMR